LGFSDEDRKENIRRVGEVASLMADAGLVVLTAFISRIVLSGRWCVNVWGKGALLRFSWIRRWRFAKHATRKGCIKSPRGELRNFTGIDAVYEAPEKPEVHLEGEQLVTNLVGQLLDLMRRDDMIRS
jgi:adenylylsulfate kinase